ncbi:DUF6383 domain-containing protein [Massilibacteroides vaginae]|uniref:DUF6383 domain-containing protein n=1 Tax=Massilibacteroides vaginae TaxID=1673718 RepID=UPI000A1C939F|nr:DUF6383 domain-containing protein [Massilibacteroides vaginae]
MNKLISTLFCGALALMSFTASAAVEPPFFKLKAQINGSDAGYVVGVSKDSVILSTDAAVLTSNAALWRVTSEKRPVSENLAYRFQNKSTNAFLTFDNDGDQLAVGERLNVLNRLDTLTEASPVYKQVFFSKEDTAKYLVKGATGKLVADANATPSDIVKLVLEVPARRWLSTVDLQENQKYTFSIPSQNGNIEGPYTFTASDNDNTVFVLNTPKGHLYVDSASWLTNSTVDQTFMAKQFGFKYGVADTTGLINTFGLLYDPTTDKVAVAVRDTMYAWDVVKKKYDAASNLSVDTAAFLGTVRFVGDYVYYTTVDSVDNPTNGNAFWVAAPQPGDEIGNIFEKNQPYTLTVVSKDAAKNDFMKVNVYRTLGQGRTGALVKDAKIKPENQWYIDTDLEYGKLIYTISNRYYAADTLLNKGRITKVDAGFVVGTDTLKIEKVANLNGYKVFSDLESKTATVSIEVVNAFGADVYLAQSTEKGDTTLVAYSTKNPIKFSFKPYQNFLAPDSFPYSYLSKKLKNEADILQAYELSTVVGKDTLYLGFGQGGVSPYTTNPYFVLSKTPARKSAFVFKAATDAEETGYLLVPVATTEPKVANPSSTEGAYVARVHERGEAVEAIQYTAVDATTNLSSRPSYFNLVLSDPIYEYAKLAAGHYTFKDESETATGLDYLTKRDNGEAKFLRVGDDLKAASIASDFALWVDSASVATSGVESLTPSYYILKGAEHFADNDSLKGNFLTVKGEFDNLNDSINFIANENGVRVNDVRANIKKESAFLFRITDADNVYEIVPFEEVEKAEPRRLALINGVVVSSSDKTALPVLVAPTTDAPVANEDVNAADAVKVSTEAGAVRIQNAAGKSVTISNILGQTVASQTISSDDVTIAAPKGIVVVSVVGEKAVKAIVK